MSTEVTTKFERAVRIRMARQEDGAALHRLIAACPPLDVNSVYAYMLICHHFRNFTVVAEGDGDGLVGCLTAYRRPDHSNVLFVWQIAVDKAARGHGLGRRMLQALIERPAAEGAHWLETTISPSNVASRRLFSAWAVSNGFQISETPYLEPVDFSTAADDRPHEAECLFRIGPLSKLQTSAIRGDPVV